MKKILLDTLTSFWASLRNSTNCASSPRGLLLIPLMLVCFALCPMARSESPPLAPVPNLALAGGNTADGQLALAGLTTGIYNSAFGIYALLSNGEANFNTGVGSGVLLANTANENTAVGAGALFSTTVGDQNTANGAFALFNNIEGIRNTAIGARALLNNTDDSNTAIGADALGTHTIGTFNVAIGGSALIGNTAGDDNTAVGVGALSQATGDGNTVLGRVAGFGLTTANNNIVIGQLSGEHSVFGQVDDSCYIDNIFGATIAAGTATIVGVDADGKLGTVAVDASGNKVPVVSLLGGQQQAMLKFAKLQATIAQQQKEIEILTGQLKEQAAQIQKVSAQLEVSKPTAQVASYEQ